MCKKLISIVIPEGVTTIENGAFKDCINLTSVTFPNSLEDIYWEAFSGCTGLTARYLKMYAILSHGHSIAVKTYQVL